MQKRKTVLHYAVSWNKIEVVEELIEAGGDINAVDEVS